jgi:hypothetical protein
VRAKGLTFVPRRARSVEEEILLRKSPGMSTPEDPGSVSVAPDEQDGYAEVGDVRLHYVEAGDGR